MMRQWDSHIIQLPATMSNDLLQASREFKFAFPDDTARYK